VGEDVRRQRGDRDDRGQHDEEGADPAAACLAGGEPVGSSLRAGPGELGATLLLRDHGSESRGRRGADIG
jgi:hypothetical protein